MKEGYIVLNQTNYGDGLEIFGVYRKKKSAEIKLRKVIKQAEKYIPGCTEDTDNSYKIWYFHEKRGDEE